jgi:hypothetical protein
MGAFLVIRSVRSSATCFTPRPSTAWPGRVGPDLLAVGYSLFLERHAAEVEERSHSAPAPCDEV